MGPTLLGWLRDGLIGLLLLCCCGVGGGGCHCSHFSVLLAVAVAVLVVWMWLLYCHCLRCWSGGVAGFTASMVLFCLMLLRRYDHLHEDHLEHQSVTTCSTSIMNNTP